MLKSGNTPKLKQINAYAKINLFLKINGILDDGYHSLSTVMSLISLFDRISIKISERQNSKPSIYLNMLNSSIPCGESNTMYKAAHLFLTSLDLKEYPSISIFTKKYIPSKAGLGGGSADAAAVLSALNELWGYPFSENELLKLGLQIGADVPFCIKGGTALCEGKGEIITPLKIDANQKKMYLLLCQPKEYVSTKEAFASYDKTANPPKLTGYANSITIQRFIKNLQNDFRWTVKRRLFNDFERVIFERYKNSKKIKDIMLENYALNSLLTGSGSCIYGIFENINAAYRCEKRVSELPFVSFCGIYSFL